MRSGLIQQFLIITNHIDVKQKQLLTDNLGKKFRVLYFHRHINK